MPKNTNKVIDNSTKKNPTTKKISKEKKQPEVVVEKPVKKDKKIKKGNIVDIIKTNIKTILLVLICLLLCVNIFIVIKGHEVKLTDGNEVIASITGKTYTAEELFDTLKTQYGTTVIVNMIDSYIVDKELGTKYDDEAKKYAESQVESIKTQYENNGSDFSTILANYGYSSEDALVAEYTESYKKELVVKSFLKDKVTDDEINEYYESEIYGDYNAKHILITPETTDDMTDDEKTAAEEAAKATAEEVIQKLNDGADWSDLVKEYSDDQGSVDSDGLIENFTKGDVVDEFFNSVLELSDGKYTTEPVKSDYGYHVILRVSAGEKPALADVKDDVITSIVSDKLEADSTLYDTTWVSIRESYKLSIKDTTVSSKYNSLIDSL